MTQEIDDVIGSSRIPKLSDKDKMPYSEAVVHEVIRISNIAPMSVPHGCSEDIKFRGYTIPKDAVLIPNLDSVMFDPDIFPNPEVFDPTRFLDENSKFLKNEKFLSFSLGKKLKIVFIYFWDSEYNIINCVCC